MKRISRGFLFLHTLWTSAIWRRRITGRTDLALAPKLVRALWLSARPGGVDRRPGSLWWKRMKRCGACPIYDKNRRACGKLDDTLGCGCAVFVKNGLPDAYCWLWVETGGKLGHDFSFPVSKRSGVE